MKTVNNQKILNLKQYFIKKSDYADFITKSINFTNTSKVVKEIDSEINNYKSLYKPFWITFALRNKCKSYELPSKELLSKVINRTFCKTHTEYFGKTKKNKHLDFMRIGHFGDGRIEGCLHHYHFTMVFPVFLIPRLMDNFEEAVSHYIPGFKGDFHIKEYNKSIFNAMDYGTRYSSEQYSDNRFFEGIDPDVSNFHFYFKEEPINCMDSHKQAMDYYKNNNQAIFSNLEQKAKQILKECVKDKPKRRK
ncbi:hypothetical protein [Leptospira ilyithenensis]|uniref:Uncharacterized protein n=1 Tax=Leptospira ilyithenensis TaxID=2484901 RepID=A0A4V3JXF1_9LEPT|nr:hypothetical protein [Leptospira ilyithenensis]TGN14046.1 hypothetical protein EHS11_02985 [Leptospira ilyithenensis]